MSYKEIGQIIRNARKDKGLTQVALCEIIQADQSYLSQIENGKPIDLDHNPTLDRLIDYLSLSRESLFALTKKGQLLRLKEIDLSEYVDVPDWGEVSAGMPKYSKTVHKMLAAHRLTPVDGRFITFVVRGNSMTMAGIPDGSRVYVLVDPSPVEGDRVVAEVRGDGFVCKRLRTRAGRKYLVSDGDDETSPIHIDNDRVNLIGKLARVEINFS